MFTVLYNIPGGIASKPLSGSLPEKFTFYHDALAHIQSEYGVNRKVGDTYHGLTVGSQPCHFWIVPTQI